MRKYRGLTKKGKWVYGWYTEAEDYYKGKRHFIILNNSRFYPFVDGDEKVIEPREYSINIIEVIPETVGQFTGKLDKNKIEIYSGDDITYSVSQAQHRRGYVFYKPCQFLIDVRWQKNDPFMSDNEGFEMEHSKGVMINSLSGKLFNLEVVGQNPELLEQDNG